jgi:hypothetical protein
MLCAVTAALHRWRWLAAGALAAALLFAGYALLPSAAPVLAAGAPVQAGPLRFTVKGLQEVPTGLTLSDASNHWIILIATVEVTDTRSWPALPKNVRLEGVDGLVKPEPLTVLRRDGSTLGPLQPGMPEDIAYVWEQRSAYTAPAEVSVSIAGLTRLDDPSGQPQWTDGPVVAQIRTGPVPTPGAPA